jgi:hypothetical protein
VSDDDEKAESIAANVRCDGCFVKQSHELVSEELIT